MSDEEVKYNKLLTTPEGSNSTRPITFGAIFSVILALLFLAQQTIPLLGVVALFLCPIPVVLMHIIFKRVKYTLLLVVVSTFIISGITTPIWGLVFLVLFGISSFAMAVFIEKGMKPMEIVILTGIVATLAAGVMMFFNFSLIDGGSLDKVMEKQKKDFLLFFDSQIKKMKKSGEDPEKIFQMEKMREIIIKNFKFMFFIFPALLLASSIFSSGINYIVTKLVLKRLGFPVLKSLPRFEIWQMPRYFLWIFVGSYFLTTFYGSSGLAGSLAFAGINLLVVCLIFYLAVGFSILHHFLKSIELSKSLVTIFYIFIVINLGLIFPFLTLAGFFDQIFDFRKLKSVSNVE